MFGFITTGGLVISSYLADIINACWKDVVFIDLLYALKFVVGMHQILKNIAEILFLLPKDSTTMPTRVENILSNAASTQLQLWFNNEHSVWLPSIECWHAGQVRVFVGVLYC